MVWNNVIIKNNIFNNCKDAIKFTPHEANTISTCPIKYKIDKIGFRMPTKLEYYKNPYNKIACHNKGRGSSNIQIRNNIFNYTKNGFKNYFINSYLTYNSNFRTGKQPIKEQDIQIVYEKNIKFIGNKINNYSNSKVRGLFNGMKNFEFKNNIMSSNVINYFTFLYEADIQNNTPKIYSPYHSYKLGSIYSRTLKGEKVAIKFDWLQKKKWFKNTIKKR
jgi:hypothetical protein